MSKAGEEGTSGPQRLTKAIKGTNIIVVGERAATNGAADTGLPAALGDPSLLYSIERDDATEVLWWHRALRPAPRLQHPAEAFRAALKEVGPATVFQTYDVRKSKLRRLAKQQYDAEAARRRREAELAPTAAFRAAVNPHKVPRAHGKAPRAEVRLLSRAGEGKHPVRSKAAHNAKHRVKRKIKKIGKSL